MQARINKLHNDSISGVGAEYQDEVTEKAVKDLAGDESVDDKAIEKLESDAAAVAEAKRKADRPAIEALGGFDFASFMGQMQQIRPPNMQALNADAAFRAIGDVTPVVDVSGVESGINELIEIERNREPLAYGGA